MKDIAGAVTMRAAKPPYDNAFGSKRGEHERQAGGRIVEKGSNLIFEKNPAGVIRGLGSQSASWKFALAGRARILSSFPTPSRPSPRKLDFSHVRY